MWVIFAGYTRGVVPSFRSKICVYCFKYAGLSGLPLPRGRADTAVDSSKHSKQSPKHTWHQCNIYIPGMTYQPYNQHQSTLWGLQFCFGGKPFKFRVLCAQNGTAALKGSTTNHKTKSTINMNIILLIQRNTSTSMKKYHTRTNKKNWYCLTDRPVQK